MPSDRARRVTQNRRRRGFLWSACYATLASTSDARSRSIFRSTIYLAAHLEGRLRLDAATCIFFFAELICGLRSRAPSPLEPAAFRTAFPRFRVWTPAASADIRPLGEPTEMSLLSPVSLPTALAVAVLSRTVAADRKHADMNADQAFQPNWTALTMCTSLLDWGRTKRARAAGYYWAGDVTGQRTGA